MLICKRNVVLAVAFLSAAALTGTLPAIAQDASSMGKLRITVNPKQAYVFVDDKAIRDGSQTIDLPAGKHTLNVANYGYRMKTEDVQISAGQTKDLNVSLQKSGDEVSGPFGDIEFKGHPRAAVLLNGTTPGYFVGHVDEFDNNWIWHQWLLVRPGTYQATITEKGNTIWSGPIPVKAGERVVVDLNHHGEMTTKDFKAGLNMGPKPRFDAGIASAMVPIAPVTAELSASQTQTNCGQPATLNWKSTDAADISISNIGAVNPSGSQTVNPLHPTMYELAAKGPGGEVTRTVTIDVNTKPTATVSLSQPVLTYHKIGDKVVEQDSAMLNWSASNADRVSIQPFGNVGTSGSEMIEAQPNQNTVGPVDRTVAYTLNVTNACGGTATETTTLHISGSIDPAPPVTLASVFYPTNYPDRRHPKVGLVADEAKILAKAAATFEKNQQYSQPGELLVIGHADIRGSKQYNLALSERRAEMVKQYLISQGIPASQIKLQADGNDRQLDEEDVQKLLSQEPQAAPDWMLKRQKTTWLAYNRRVDIVLEPAGQRSTESYPEDVPEARILWQRPQPNLTAVQTASASVGGAQQTLAELAK
jgi:hypothetical protein